MSCPCGSGLELSQCCEPIILGKKKASTAEELMRARYTAYTQKNMEFVEITHDPKTRSNTDMQANIDWAERTKWLGLEIISTDKGGADDEVGTVEFKAKFDTGEGEDTHHELSQFNKKKGIWYFTDGKDPRKQTFVRAEKKIGRNDPCPCGSGKKYKKCCGK